MGFKEHPVAAGMAFTMVTRSHHRIPAAPFILYCDYPIANLTVSGNQARFRIIGEPDFTCRLRLIKTGRSPVRAKVIVDGEKPMSPSIRGGDPEFSPAGGSQITTEWANNSRKR